MLVQINFKLARFVLNMKVTVGEVNSEIKKYTA